MIKIKLNCNSQHNATALSSGEKNEDEKDLNQIKKVLKSQWSKRVQKSDNKTKQKPPKVSSGKVVLKESVLDISSKETNVTKKVEKFYNLDESLLHKLQKTGLVKFCQKVQKYIRGSGKFPALVKDFEQSSTNPIGCALVERACKVRTRKFEGNIICGVCGDWAYCRDVRKSKYLGAFVCDPCKTFLQEKSSQKSPAELSCVRGKAECLILPTKEKCEACWLGLCLRVCQFDQRISERLRQSLGASQSLHQTQGPSGLILHCVG